jgi:hypothetical protein
MSKARKHLIVGLGVVEGVVVGIGVGLGVVVRCIGTCIVIVIAWYRGGGELVYILAQGQGGKGTDMIYIHTCIHTHDVQGYIGHTTTNLHASIAVTVLGMTRDVISVPWNAHSPIVRRELSAANDSDNKGPLAKVSDSRGRCRGNIKSRK